MQPLFELLKEDAKGAAALTLVQPVRLAARKTQGLELLDEALRACDAAVDAELLLVRDLLQLLPFLPPAAADRVPRPAPPRHVEVGDHAREQLLEQLAHLVLRRLRVLELLDDAHPLAVGLALDLPAVQRSPERAQVAQQVAELAERLLAAFEGHGDALADREDHGE